MPEKEEVILPPLLAVKLYGENTKGVPTQWPEKVIENPIEIPSGWVGMTLEDYHAHRAVLQDDYDVWKAAQEIEEEVPLVAVTVETLTAEINELKAEVAALKTIL